VSPQMPLVEQPVGHLVVVQVDEEAWTSPISPGSFAYLCAGHLTKDIRFCRNECVIQDIPILRIPICAFLAASL
jgi:hypothetical protein